jgi:hypothetical protein
VGARRRDQASNVGATSALEEHIVDFVAPDLPTLLNEMDGYKTKPKGIVMHTANAQVDTVEMSLWTRALDLLVDPNLIVLLMSIGCSGSRTRSSRRATSSPAPSGRRPPPRPLRASRCCRISVTGLLLMLLAFGFFGAEAFVTSHGVLAIAGTVCFVLGSLLLFNPAGDAYQVSVWVALAIAGTLAVLVGIALTKVVALRRTRPQTGIDELVGEAASCAVPSIPRDTCSSTASSGAPDRRRADSRGRAGQRACARRRPRADRLARRDAGPRACRHGVGWPRDRRTHRRRSSSHHPAVRALGVGQGRTGVRAWRDLPARPAQVAAEGPGLFLLIPIVDKMVRVDLRTVTLNVPPAGGDHEGQRAGAR